MEDVNYFKDLFESTPEYEKIVLLMILIKNDDNFLHECGFLKVTLTFCIKKLKIFYLNWMKIT